MIARSRRQSGRSLPFIRVFALCTSLPFLTFYWMHLSRAIPEQFLVQPSAWLMPLSLLVYVPFAMCAVVLFSHLWSYLLITLVSLLTSSIALFNARTWLHRMGWLLLMAAAGVFPYGFRYQPPLVATAPHHMIWVTNPGLVHGVLKAAQNLSEQTPCTYRLLGWSANHQLYYEARCQATMQIWRVTPQHTPQPERVTTLPTRLSGTTIPPSTLLAQVRATGIRPQRHETSTPPLFIAGQGMLSSDGHWSALVSQYPFGTQDVLLLTTHTE